MTTATLPRTAHRRATVPDPARLILRDPAPLPTFDDLDVLLGHVLIGAELDAIRDDVASMRVDLDEIRAGARVEEFLASIETSLYLTTALEYALTEDDVVAIAARALHLGRPGGIACPDEALDLALAALRGWTHRQALAAGGVR